MFQGNPGQPTYNYTPYGNPQEIPVGTQPLKEGQEKAVVTQPLKEGPAYVKSNDGAAQFRSKVDDYFWYSLLACILCVWPLGLCAMVASYEANRSADRGDYVKARAKARWALYLLIASVVFGLVLHALQFARIFNYL